MGYCFGWSGPGFLGGISWLSPLLFWGLLITSVVFLFKGFKQDDSQEALDILEKEYAKGKISKEEFQERKQELKK